jgi:hypothetical protein
MPAIKRFRPNMPQRKSADSRSARFAADPISEVQDEQQVQTQVQDDPIESIGTESSQSEIDHSASIIAPSVAPIMEPGQLMDSKDTVVTMPSSTIIRQHWKQ